MSDPRPEDLPIGAVDASGEPTTVAGVTPPEQPPMVDADGAGEINGGEIDGGEIDEGESDGEADDDLQVQGGE